MSLCARHARILALVLSTGISAPAFAIGVNGPGGEALTPLNVDAVSSTDFVRDALSVAEVSDSHGANHVQILSDFIHPDAACINSFKLFYRPDSLSAGITQIYDVPHLEKSIRTAISEHERHGTMEAKVTVEEAGVLLPAIVLLGALGCFSVAAMPRRR